MGLRSQYGPAPGAKGGRPVYDAAGATFPDFLRMERMELAALMDVIREPLVLHVYMLLRAFCEWKTGEFLGNYQTLEAWCTPPKNPAGRTVPGPTRKQVIRAVKVLEDCHLVTRGLKNEEQGQLRLKLTALAPAKKPRS